MRQDQLNINKTERAKKFTSGSRDVDRHSEVREYRKLVKHACNVSGNAPTGLQVRSMHQSFVGLLTMLTIKPRGAI